MLIDLGGHASERFEISEGVDIVKVEVGRSHELNGLRFLMSDGTAGGYLYESDPKYTLGKQQPPMPNL